MAEPGKTADVVRFGPFELLIDIQELRKHGLPLKLSGQAIQVLAMLSANPGKLITREELQQKLWPGAPYGDPNHGLNAAVNKLRETLGDSSTDPKYIETVPGRGYRFIAQQHGIPPESRRRKLLVVPSLVTGALVAIALVAGSFYWHSRRPLAPFSATEWMLTGSQPDSYEAGTDPREVFNGHPSACLRAKERSTKGFGTLMQAFQAREYLRKRVRFRAFVKSEAVERSARLWMRVDKGREIVAFDNMETRKINGTTSWQKYDLVLDVPPDATGVFFGVLLEGPGKVWLNGIEFETVGSDVPTTGGIPSQNLGDKPKLGFEK